MLTNCFRFAPRDSVPGLIAKICKYLKDHPGWSEEELEDQIKQFIGQTGVESFNGRTGAVVLNESDVNNLKIASAYFAEGDETIDRLDLVTLYNQGVRFVFTNWNSVTSSYDLSFVLDYFSGSNNVVYYPMSTGSGGGSVVSVNGKTGIVDLSLSDILGGSGAQVKLCTANEFTLTTLTTWNEYYRDGYRVVGVVNSDASAIDYIYLLKQDENNHQPIGLSAGASDAYTPTNPPPYPVVSVNGKIGAVTGFYDAENPPPYPVTSVNSKTGAALLKVVDVSNGNSSDENAYIFIDEDDNYPDVVSSDSSKLGGKAPEYYIQPRNLLDNSDFTNPVNQRGANGAYEAWGGYTIDRWAAYVNGATIGLTNDGINLFNGIYQKISANELSRYSGKAMTFAAMIDGVVYTASGIIEQTGAWHIVSKVDTACGYISFEIQNDNSIYAIIANNTKAGLVNWAALYEGNYTAETLPPYVPKGYAAEFVECRRYYKRFTSPNASIICAGYVTGGTKFIYFNPPDNYPMRINKPSCAFTGAITVRGINGYIEEDYSGARFGVYANVTGCVSMIELTRADSSAWNATNNTPLFVQFHGDSVFELIADL